jgi:hypothetical protein
MTAAASVSVGAPGSWKTQNNWLKKSAQRYPQATELTSD